jgi:uncharacterized membrane protein YqiK
METTLVVFPRREREREREAAKQARTIHGGGVTLPVVHESSVVHLASSVSLHPITGRKLWGTDQIFCGEAP